METQTRFDEYVDLYDKYRLPYNTDVLNDVVKFIQRRSGDLSIADIGAGTGILTRQLLKYKFDKYYAIEPNELMQEKATTHKITKNKNIIYMNNNSVKTGLSRSSVDVIFVGTALHWFEPKKTLTEFKRVLKKGGVLVVLTSGYCGPIGDDLYDMHKKYRDHIYSPAIRYKPWTC